MAAKQAGKTDNQRKAFDFLKDHFESQAPFTKEDLEAVTTWKGGTQDAIEHPPVSTLTQDSDGDGVVNELPTENVDYLEFYLLNYFTPATYRQDSVTREGLRLFRSVGCAECHRQNLTIEHDRRVADVETAYDPA